MLFYRLAGFSGLRDDAIVNFGYIHDLHHAITFELKVSPEHISRYRRTKISDMAVVPNRRPAVIEFHFAFDNRAKLFEPTRECVVYSQHGKEIESRRRERSSQTADTNSITILVASVEVIKPGRL